MKSQSESIIKTVPAAEALRRVPQFDPLRYLRQTTSRKTGESVLKLDLRFKKMWFRLACADGRMVLNPMRITDSMAIFEAQVYLHEEDPAPIANFVSTMYAKDVPNGRYIQAAQDEALNEALDNAGFGIQLADLVEATADSGYGSEIPVEQIRQLMDEPPQQAGQKTQESSAPAESTVLPAQKETVAMAEPPVSASEHSEPDQTEDVTEEPAAGLEAPPVEPLPASQADPPHGKEPPKKANETAGILQMLGTKPPAVSEAPQDISTEEEPVQEESAQGQDVAAQYTDDMSVEEITQRMSVDEARAIVVPFGTCKGWTLGEVMERRASSLRFYLYSAKDAGNVLKAAASLLLDELALKKAG